jgi:hypothetical protein
MTAGWIGVDLDGTIAKYDGWQGPDHVGEPIEPMVALVKDWLRSGKDVRIFTARVSTDGSAKRNAEVRIAHWAIRDWCKKHLGWELPVTCSKDFGMQVLYDDRCVQVESNTGRLISSPMDAQESKDYRALLQKFVDLGRLSEARLKDLK